MPLPSLPLFLAAQQHAQNDANKVAVIDATKQESFTFTQLLEDAAALRKQILELLGLTATGDLEERRIAFLVPNGYDYVVTQWATWAAGGVAVPLCKLLPVLRAIVQLLTTIRHKPPRQGAPIYHRRLGPFVDPHPPCLREIGSSVA